MVSPQRRGLFHLCILAFCLGCTTLLAAAQVIQVTTNTTDDGWLLFSETQGVTSQGKILWLGFDPADGTTPAVLFWNGSIISVVQKKDAGVLELAGDVNTTFALGSGSTLGQVVGAWRRGQDFPWVWVSGSSPLLANIVDPFDAATVVNPETPVVIGDGCVFWRVQTPDTGNAKLPKQVYRINPVTGDATNLTGANNLADADANKKSLSTSNCQAVWVFDADSADNTSPLQLHFHNGVLPPASVPPAAVDSGVGTLASLGRGRIVYSKDVSGVTQIFLFDTNLSSPAPVQLTSYADSTKTIAGLRTDGWNAAWLYGDKDLTFAKTLLNADVILNGDVTLAHVGDVAKPLEKSFQLQRGQLLWKDSNNALHYYDGRQLTTVNLAPASTVDLPWLADGFIAWNGLSTDGGGDKEIFLFTGTTPVVLGANEPAPPLAVVATGGDGQVTVSWNQILGAASYNLYMAAVAGVTKSNWQSLPGGMKHAGVTSPFVHTGLTNNQTYYFVVTAVAGGIEGPNSGEASATPMGNWQAASGVIGGPYTALGVDQADGQVAYAFTNSNLFKTTNGGASWSGVAASLPEFRALAARGTNVYAATRIGSLRRSIDGGANWTDETPGSIDLGETNKALAIDPVTPATVYAGDLKLTTMVEPDDSFVIKSTDSGDNWAHTAEINVLGGEIHAYALAPDPLASGTLYAGGTGTPNVAKTTDGGTTWTDVGIPGVSQFIYALAIHPSQTSTVYAGTGGGAPKGVYKTTNSGGAWTAKNAGLPDPPPQVNSLVIDPADPNVVYAGTTAGFFVTRDGGENWTAHNGGLVSAPEQTINALALTSSRQLVAATNSGLFLLDLVIPPPVTNATFTGKVKDASGVAVAGATVGAYQAAELKFSTTSGSDGRYSLGVTAGTYDLVASKPGDGFLDTTKSGLTIAANQTLIKTNFKLFHPSFFQGTVTNKSNGSPLAGVLVEVLKSGIVQNSTTTGVDGTYSVETIKGTYTVRFSKSGFKTKNKNLQTIGDNTTKTLNIALPPLSGGAAQQVNAVTDSNNPTGYAFSPANVTVNRNDTVLFANASGATHNVVWDSPNSPSNSPAINPNGTWSVVMTNAGTFNYHCSIHGLDMNGTITVNP